MPLGLDGKEDTKLFASFYFVLMYLVFVFFIPTFVNDFEQYY